MSQRDPKCPYCGATIGPYELHACNPLALALKRR